MISARTRALLIAATVLSGLLAGGNVDRAIVAMPAWEQVGAAAWAEFSRHTLIWAMVLSCILWKRSALFC
jgi:hypothetical protein